MVKVFGSFATGMSQIAKRDVCHDRFANADWVAQVNKGIIAAEGYPAVPVHTVVPAPVNQVPQVPQVPVVEPNVDIEMGNFF